MPTRTQTATTTEAIILNVDSTRIAAVIQNVGSEAIWVSDEPDKAGAHAALKLNPMGSVTILLLAGLRPDKTWYVAADTGTSTVAVHENFYAGTIPGGGGGGGNGGGGGGTMDGRNAAAALFAAFGAGGALG